MEVYTQVRLKKVLAFKQGWEIKRQVTEKANTHTKR